MLGNVPTARPAPEKKVVSESDCTCSPVELPSGYTNCYYCALPGTGPTRARFGLFGKDLTLLIGELVGLSCAAVWATVATTMRAASDRTSPVMINGIRCTIARVTLALIVLATGRVGGWHLAGVRKITADSQACHRWPDQPGSVEGGRVEGDSVPTDRTCTPSERRLLNFLFDLIPIAEFVLAGNHHLFPSYNPVHNFHDPVLR